MKKLSNIELHQKLKFLVRQERLATKDVLVHMLEVYKRRIFLEMGYGSMFEYCRVELKYSESAACRRIAAMKLLEQNPEILSKIDQGVLNLSTVLKAKNFLKDKKCSPAQQKEIFEKIENKSMNETDNIFSKLDPSYPKNKEVIRQVNENEKSVTLIIDDILYEKIENLQNVHAHKLNKKSVKELLEYLVDQEIKKIEKEKYRPLTSAAEVKQIVKPPKENATGQTILVDEFCELNIKNQNNSRKSRYVPIEIRRRLLQKSEGKCEFVGENGKRCCSTWKLQVDHVFPFAWGGLATEKKSSGFMSAP